MEKGLMFDDEIEENKEEQEKEEEILKDERLTPLEKVMKEKLNKINKKNDN